MLISPIIDRMLANIFLEARASTSSTVILSCCKWLKQIEFMFSHTSHKYSNISLYKFLHYWDYIRDSIPFMDVVSIFSSLRFLCIQLSIWASQADKLKENLKGSMNSWSRGSRYYLSPWEYFDLRDIVFSLEMETTQSLFCKAWIYFSVVIWLFYGLIT